MSEERRKGGLVVEDRPQISVELVDQTDIVISVARIANDFTSVDNEEVVFPAECGKEVARAILNLLKR